MEVEGVRAEICPVKEDEVSTRNEQEILNFKNKDENERERRLTLAG